MAASATSTNNVWAVGSVFSGVNQTLIENWNGSNWSIVPSPNANAFGNQLDGVAALPSGDAWAVGSYDDGTKTFRTLVELWNGTQWTIIPSPNASPYSNELLSVTAVSARDAWTVGTFNDGTRNKTLTEHWNGLEWKIVHSESPSRTFSDLTSVSAVSASDIWAVGTRWNGNSDKTLAEHWNGSRWSIVQTPNTRSIYNDLWGVAAVSSSTVLTVGDYEGARDFRALGLLFHC